MRLIDENDGRLRCTPDEILTITVEPNKKTAKTVIFSLDGKTHDGSPFPASDDNHPPQGNNSPTRILSVGVLYTDKTDGGGSAKIKITGSDGGDTSSIVTRQSRPSEAGDIVNYLIFV